MVLVCDTIATIKAGEAVRVSVLSKEQPFNLVAIGTIKAD
jgi:hypothetical protein